jgi:hypothetical protein
VADVEAKARKLARRIQDGLPGLHSQTCLCIDCEKALTTAIGDALRAQYQAGALAAIEAARRAVAKWADDAGRDGLHAISCDGAADAIGSRVEGLSIGCDCDGPNDACPWCAIPVSPPSDPRPGAETVRCPRCKRPRRILANGVACWNTGGPYCIPRDEPAVPQAEPRDEGAKRQPWTCDDCGEERSASEDTCQCGFEAEDEKWPRKVGAFHALCDALGLVDHAEGVGPCYPSTEEACRLAREIALSASAHVECPAPRPAGVPTQGTPNDSTDDDDAVNRHRPGGAGEP